MRFITSTQIECTDENDQAFLAMAEGSSVNGTTLPSGDKVPDSPQKGMGWVIRKGYIHLEANK